MTCERCRQLAEEVDRLQAEALLRESELAALAERAAAWLDRKGDREGAGLIRVALLGERTK
jgi:hypothetical protein